MKKLLVLCLIVSLTACVSVPPPSNYVKCDGKAKPQPVVSQTVKLLLTSSLLIPTQLPETSSPRKRRFGEAGITACNLAIAEGLVPNNSLRHLNLIRARAIHHLENKNARGAIADVGIIDGIAGENIDNPGYARSFGLAVDLVRGTAQIETGETARGIATLETAAKKRPFALSLQVFLIDPVETAYASKIEAPNALLDRLSLLSPDYYYVRSRFNDLRGIAPEQIASDRDYLARNAPKSDLKVIKKGPGAGLVYKDLKVQAHAALAHAHVGNVKRAQFWLDKASQHDAAISTLETEVYEATQANVEPVKRRDHESRQEQARYRKIRSGLQKADRIIDAHRAGQVTLNLLKPFIKSWIAVHQGNPQQAADFLEPIESFPHLNVSFELVEELQKNKAVTKTNKWLGIDIPATREKWRTATILRIKNKSAFAAQSPFNWQTGTFGRTPSNYSRLYNLVPLSEMTTRRNRFSGQAILFKPTGFSHKKNTNGNTEIEFMGDNSSRAQVEEMTILRAAVLAQEEAKDALILLSFKNYNRMVTQTMNGRPTGPSTLVGYKTVLVARFVNEEQVGHDYPDHVDRVISVKDILTQLAPIYAGGK